MTTPKLGPDDCAALVFLEAILAGLRAGEVRIREQKSSHDGDGGTFKVCWQFVNEHQVVLGEPPEPAPPAPAEAPRAGYCADCRWMMEEDPDGWTCPRCLTSTPRTR